AAVGLVSRNWCAGHPGRSLERPSPPGLVLEPRAGLLFAAGPVRPAPGLRVGRSGDRNPFSATVSPGPAGTPNAIRRPAGQLFAAGVPAGVLPGTYPAGESRGGPTSFSGPGFGETAQATRGLR